MERPLLRWVREQLGAAAVSAAVLAAVVPGAGAFEPVGVSLCVCHITLRCMYLWQSLEKRVLQSRLVPRV